MKKLNQILTILFACMFMGGIAIGLIGRGICYQDNDAYDQPQEELALPDPIERVLRDSEQKMLYVCYMDSNHVDAYTESGQFLWGVETKYIRNPYFELQDEKLIIYGGGTAYVYNSKDGTFVTTANEDDLQLEYLWQNTTDEIYRAGEFYFSSYEVCRADENGNLRPVISRPWWHRIFSPLLCLPVAFGGAAGWGLLYYLELWKDYKNVRKTVKLRTKRVRRLVTYLKVMTIVQAVLAILAIPLAVFELYVGIGMIPLTVHFIISGIVIENLADNADATTDEHKVLSYRKATALATFLLAFVSMVISFGMAP